MEQKQPVYKIIFHIDMNCFFASCEMAVDPSLVGKPIVVAHHDVFRKSIILTASYEARKYGIKTTMMTKDAIRLCPALVIVEPKMHLYQQYSKVFFDYLLTITQKLEITSIDEGYLDVTDVVNGPETMALAQKIQNDLLKLHHLPCSIGIAPNKFLAKMASDMKKPLGITILRKREVQEKLWPLPIKAMIGVGKKTEPRLQAIGIYTIGDIIHFEDRDLLEKTVGSAMSEYLLDRANGNDSSDVNYQPDDEVSSISHAHTFHYNVISIQVIKDTLKVLSNSVSQRLINRGLFASTVGIQLKFGDFQQINRSRGLVDGIQE
ncbi:MAG: DNA polymerase IV, partial [Bacilli bacterium]